MKKKLCDILIPDTYIYGWGINGDSYELYLDIDCICSVIYANGAYMFEVSPATLVFSNVWNLSIEIETNDAIIVENVEVNANRTSHNNRELWEYTVIIDCLQGSISFNAVGGELIKRTKGVLQKQEYIGISRNRPINFGLTGEHIDIIMSDGIASPTTESGDSHLGSKQ